MSESSSHASSEWLDSLECTRIDEHSVHFRRVGPAEKTTKGEGVPLMLLQDIRKILSDPSATEAATLARLSKQQKRFFTFAELVENPSNGACVIPIFGKKSTGDFNDTPTKQRTASKSAGVWFITVDAALKLAFKFCAPEHAIRISLDLSPFLIATYATAYEDPLEVLESVSYDDLPKQFKLAMEAKTKEKLMRSSKLQRFSGSEAVDWLVKAGAATTRVRGVEVGSRLLQSGLFRNLTSPSKQEFVDKSSEYYTFEENDTPVQRATSSSISTPTVPIPAVPIHQTASTTGATTISTSSTASPSRAFSKPLSSLNTSPHSAASTPTAVSAIVPSGLPQPFSLFILGSGESGKTSLWSALSSRKQSQILAVGKPVSSAARPWNHVQIAKIQVPMDQDEYSNQIVNLSVWDFDAHNIGTTTNHLEGIRSLSYIVHRGFVSSHGRVAALVVFDLNRLDMVDLDFWIASLAKHAPHAPVIIVGTHSDTVNAKHKSNTKIFITKRYAKVKNVRGYISVSVKSAADMEKLKQLYLQHTLHSLGAQIKRERPQLTLPNTFEDAITAVSASITKARNGGASFYPLADIRSQLAEKGVPDSNMEEVMGYLQADSIYFRVKDSLDNYTCMYGKPECDLKRWAILDFNYFFKIAYALNLAPPMLKMRGLISLSSILEALRTVEVPPDFMLDSMSYFYHELYGIYCMVALLISTVQKEAHLLELKKREEEALPKNRGLATRATTYLNAPQPGQSANTGPQSILARVPNPDTHCFAAPFMTPLAFDQKVLSWTKRESNELVRVYSFDRLPGQLIERSSMQLILAMLTQLRNPFLKKEGQESPRTADSKTRRRSRKSSVNPESAPASAKTSHLHDDSSDDTIRTSSSSKKRSKTKSRDEAPKSSKEESAHDSIADSQKAKSTSSLAVTPKSDSTKIPDAKPHKAKSRDTMFDEKEKVAAKKDSSPPRSFKFNKSEPKALQDIKCDHIEWTQQGISFSVAGENGFSGRVYTADAVDKETALIIRVHSDTPSGSARGLRLILDNINGFVMWEFRNVLSEVFIPCTCVDCMKHRSNPKFVPLPIYKNACTFTFEECERALGNGYSSLPCSVYGNEVPLDSLVPDIVMSDLDAFKCDYDEIYKERELARSSNGIVYKGIYNEEVVAVKELTVNLSTNDSSASDIFAEFRHEVWVSSLLKHENIVGLKAWTIKIEDSPNGGRVAHLALVMEFIPNGDLYDWLHDSKAHLTWDKRLQIAEEIANGMLFLHTLNPPIVHHDLKSANVFVVSKATSCPTVVRVGDFGEARTNFSANSREKVDNPLWLAPEVMQKQKYEAPADVYAFGIILWELVAREHPFAEFPQSKSQFKSDLEDAIVAGLRPTIDDKVEAELPISSSSNRCIPLYAELAKECWGHDRRRRPTFQRILSTLQDIRAAMEHNEEIIAADALSKDSPVLPEIRHPEWVSIVESVEKTQTGASLVSLRASAMVARDQGSLDGDDNTASSNSPRDNTNNGTVSSEIRITNTTNTSEQKNQTNTSDSSSGTPAVVEHWTSAPNPGHEKKMLDAHSSSFLKPKSSLGPDTELSFRKRLASAAMVPVNQIPDDIGDH